jgi:hypothetical protein
METTLHRQLKALYVDDPSQREVTVDGFRIDAVLDDGTLVEIQCASLSAIRDKIRRLLETHAVRVVKPLAARKLLITRQRKNGPVVSQRHSPSRATTFELFDELVHFTTVFPHESLTLEVLLVDVEEHRIRRKPRRWRGKDYRVADRTLRSVTERRLFRTAGDLLAFLPGGLPDDFTTADVARLANVPRWLAQKAAYCLRQTGAVSCIAQRGRLRLYRRNDADEPEAAVPRAA